MKINKAVIAIAGKGSRMAPITSAIPKEMLPIGTTPILQMIIDEVISSGIDEILFVISTDRQIVTEYLCGVRKPEDYNAYEKTYSYSLDQSVKIRFVYQKKPLGTANAVSLAKKFADGEPFALLYGDDLFVGDKPALKELIELSEAKNGASVIGVQHINRLEASNYATVVSHDFDGKKGRIQTIIEKQRAEDISSDLTSVGRYVLSSDVFEFVDKVPVHNKETWITDAINDLAENEDVYACLIESVRHDTGSPEGYIHAFKTLC